MLFHNSSSAEREMGKEASGSRGALALPATTMGITGDQRAQFPSGSWHSNSTRLLTFLETKHSSRVKKARERMEAWKSSSGDHTWINQTRCTSKSYWATPQWEHEKREEGERLSVRYQLFPVLVTFSIQHQSSGSASFNDNLLIKKFSLHTAPLWFLFQSRALPGPSQWEILNAKSFFPGSAAIISLNSLPANFLMN